MTNVAFALVSLLYEYKMCIWTVYKWIEIFVFEDASIENSVVKTIDFLTN